MSHIYNSQVLKVAIHNFIRDIFLVIGFECAVSNFFGFFSGGNMSAYYSGARRASATSAAIRPALGFTVLALSVPLIGCSIHPLPDDVSRASTYDIVDKIRCEAKAAVEEYGRKFTNASIVYNFSFNINEENDASAGLTMLDPFRTGTVSLTGNAGSTRNRAGNRNFELIDSFDDLRKLKCTRDREVNWVYPLTGDVGMYEAVSTFIRLQQADDPRTNDPVPGARIFTFADTLTYTTTLTGGVNASLTLTPVKNQFRVTSANAGLSGSRTDTHKVVVTMAAGQQPVVKSGKVVAFRRTVPRVDAPLARGGTAGAPVYGSNGSFNAILTTRMLQQESSAENRALYEQDRQRQLELQRQSQDVRVLVGP